MSTIAEPLQKSKRFTRSDKITPTDFDKSELAQDFWQIVVLFAGSVFAVYFAPPVVNYLFFLIPLVLFWISRKDYFWFGFYFVIINSPAHFFSETSGAAVNRLPLYSVLPGVSFSVFDLFVLLSIAKVLKYNINKSFTLAEPLKLLLFYLLVISLPMTFILGMGESSFFNNFRPFAYYLILISFYFLINRVEDLYKLGYLVLPFLFFIVFDQIFLIGTGDLLVGLVDPHTSRDVVEDTITGGTRAVFGGELLVFYSLLVGLQLSSAKKYELFNGFAFVVIFLAFSAILLSATRSWLIMSGLVLITFYIGNSKAITNFLKLILISAGVAITLFMTGIISVDYFVNNIWPRFGAFFQALESGNLAQFDTAGARLESDWPFSMEGVMHSPILGTGFSGIFRYYVNNDLGFINTILMLGIVGFLIFIYFLIILFKKIQVYIHNRFQDHDTRVILISIKALLIGMLAGYATTWDFFTVRQIERIFFVSFIIASVEISIRHIKNNQRNFLNKLPKYK